MTEPILPPDVEATVSRQDYIGSLDASCVVGVDPYRSTYQLWREKTGRDKPDPEIGKKWAVVKGRALEDPILDRFADFMGVEVTGRQDEFHVQKHPFIRCHVDGWYIDSKGNHVVVDAKAPGFYNARNYKSDTGELPPPAMFQMFHFFLCNPKFAYGYVAVDKGNEIDWVKVERNDESINLLLELELKFWKWVEDDVEPPFSEINVTADDLKTRFPKEEDTDVIDVAPDFDAIITRREQLKKQIKEMEEEIEGIDLELKTTIGEHTGVRTPQYVITYKYQAGATTYDHKRIEAEHPGFLDEYKRQGGYRKMYIKTNKEEKE